MSAELALNFKNQFHLFISLIKVPGDGDQAYKLQKQITNSKCKFFVTVLGKSSVLNNF